MDHHQIKLNEMDCLITCYTERFAKIDGNIFEVFSQFYDLDLSPVESWLETKFKKKIHKDDSKSTNFRQEGNKCYARKDLLNSLKLYTQSLCYATPNGREYGLALANRSAVSFEMKEFENCLKDIDLCFDSDYPVDLKPKVYFRKAECYFETGHKENLEKCISEIYKFLSSSNVVDKDKHIEKLQQMKKTKIKPKFLGYNGSDHQKDLPEFEEGESSNFMFASSKIKMRYDNLRGRHVVAKKPIHQGDVLFIEKAFMFAPVYKKNKQFHSFKCYNCLEDTVSSIPCRTCTLCVFCNEKCRNASWKHCHRWECQGMQAEIWYDLGIAFPAFRALLKGIRSGFRTIKGNCEEDLKHFGDKNDNYPYFSRLVSHIYKNKNGASYTVMAAVVVTYLKKYTEFFTWLLKQENCPKKDLNNLVKYVGGLITKHIGQLSCNSSVIEHWRYTTSDLLFPDELIPVACGMFPSVSIMNHSCKPNVTNFFICDTIIVKALENISENEEIFNCYGIDYRLMKKGKRQVACRRRYHFECKCVICIDPSREMDMLDSYLCSKCRDIIPDVPEADASFCINCGDKYSLKTFRSINEEAQNYLESEDNQLEPLLKCLKIREKILYKHHKDFEEVYYRLYSYYVETGDAENMFTYFHLWLENEKARKGERSKGIGIKLYEAALAILHCLQNGYPKNGNSSNLKAFLKNVENMIREAKMVLNLYFPAHITNKLSRKLQYMSNHK